MATITDTDGEVLAVLPWEEAAAWLAARDLDAAGLVVTPAPAEERAGLRAQIAQAAGDRERLIGTYGDGVLFLMASLAAAAGAMQNATTLAQVKAAFMPLAEALQPLAEGLESGSMQLPHAVKDGGQQGQLAEIWARATAIAAALDAPAAPPPDDAA